MASGVIDKFFAGTFDKLAEQEEAPEVHGVAIEGINNIALIPYIKPLSAGTPHAAVMLKIRREKNDNPGISDDDVLIIQGLDVESKADLKATVKKLEALKALADAEKSAASGSATQAIQQKPVVVLSEQEQDDLEEFLSSYKQVKGMFGARNKPKVKAAYDALSDNLKASLNVNDAFDPELLGLPAKSLVVAKPEEVKPTEVQRDEAVIEFLDQYEKAKAANPMMKALKLKGLKSLYAELTDAQKRIGCYEWW